MNNVVLLPGTRVVDRAKGRTEKGVVIVEGLVLPPTITPGKYIIRVSDEGLFASSIRSTTSTSGANEVFCPIGAAAYSFEVPAPVETTKTKK